MEISNEQRLKNELQQAKEHISFLQDIIDSLPVYILVSEFDPAQPDKESDNIWANARVHDFAQQMGEKVDSQFLQRIIHPDDYSHVEHTIDFLKNNPEGLVYSGILRVKGPNNDYFWINNNTAVLRQLVQDNRLQCLHVAFDLIAGQQCELPITQSVKELYRKRNGERLKNISKREQQVLKLLIQGFTDKEIASSLYISERTAQTHRNKLIKKTGTRNTATLVAFLSDCGLV